MLKINKIYNDSLNIIGISCINENIDINSDSNSTSNRNEYQEWFNSDYYIGWSASGADYYRWIPNGLVCGWNKHQSSNIFYNYGFKYVGNNQYYQKRLPGIYTNDIIILEYNSYFYTLSFKKKNDPKLDAYIYHLPQNKTFYWIVGHFLNPMSISIVQ